ncbi:MAG: hypothetical protein AB1428_13845 [Bacteroidota bacterium]
MDNVAVVDTARPTRRGDVVRGVFVCMDNHSDLIGSIIQQPLLEGRVDMGACAGKEGEQIAADAKEPYVCVQRT